MICVLMVASGATWESRALDLLNRTADVVVLKRCVDVDDLLATATVGQADVAVVALDAPGLDASAIDHLHRHRVRPVGVGGTVGATGDADRTRAARWGIAALVDQAQLDLLPHAVTTVDEVAPELGTEADQGVDDLPATEGRVVVVWGPGGAPGRTTVAVSVAAELASRGRRTLLVDADPYGGAIAQQLGVMDEVSGLLSAARLSASGDLAERFASVQRSLSPGLSVITGLPRPDRWTEVRTGVVEHLVETGRERGQVVVDTGFSLESDPAADFGSRPARNTLTLGALAVADEIIVVGSADPVGLSRLSRGLVELDGLVVRTPVHVVVNRYRPSLGWSRSDIVDMLEGFGRPRGVHFLPEDRAAVDRALMAGRTLVEGGDSALGRAVAGLVDEVLPDSVAAPSGRGRIRRRTSGRARRR